MPDRSETSMPACQWRIGESCSLRTIQRIRNGEGDALQQGSEVELGEPLSILGLLDTWLKTGPSLDDLRCSLVEGCRYCHAQEVTSSCETPEGEPCETGGPNFDRYHRILTVDGIFVRQFLRDAENQMRILNAFQDQHWPHRIDNAFPRAKPGDPNRRPSDAVSDLNRNYKHKLIHFWVEKGTRGICWKRIPPAQETAHRPSAPDGQSEDDG